MCISMIGKQGGLRLGFRKTCIAYTIFPRCCSDRLWLCSYECVRKHLSYLFFWYFAGGMYCKVFRPIAKVIFLLTELRGVEYVASIPLCYRQLLARVQLRASWRTGTQLFTLNQSNPIGWNGRGCKALTKEKPVLLATYKIHGYH
jgi:hypothetical protein